MYHRGLELGLSMNEMYDMTLKELDDVINYTRQGLAYNLWKQGAIIARMVSKEPYGNPEEACPELFPPKKTYKGYDFLKDKSKRKGEVKK